MAEAESETQSSPLLPFGWGQVPGAGDCKGVGGRIHLVFSHLLSTLLPLRNTLYPLVLDLSVKAESSFVPIQGDFARYFSAITWYPGIIWLLCSCWT